MTILCAPGTASITTLVPAVTSILVTGHFEVSYFLDVDQPKKYFQSRYSLSKSLSNIGIICLEQPLKKANIGQRLAKSTVSRPLTAPSVLLVFCVCFFASCFIMFTWFILGLSFTKKITWLQTVSISKKHHTLKLIRVFRHCLSFFHFSSTITSMI